MEKSAVWLMQESSLHKICFRWKNIRTEMKTDCIVNYLKNHLKYTKEKLC